MKRLIVLSLAVVGLTATAAFAQFPTLLPAASPDAVPVKLELYSRDKESAAFSEALQQAVAGDDRYVLVEDLPKDGLRIIVAEPLRKQEEDSRSLRIYNVTYKLGSGKYIGDDQGLCDADRLTMCGRVVAEDAHVAYTAYIARHPPKN